MPNSNLDHFFTSDFSPEKAVSGREICSIGSSYTILYIQSFFQPLPSPEIGIPQGESGRGVILILVW
jgi:hypothetical protein